MCVHAELLQSCLTLCDLMDYSPPGSSVHEILQARTLEWIVIPSSRGFSQFKDQTHVSCLGETCRQKVEHQTLGHRSLDTERVQAATAIPFNTDDLLIRLPL